MTPSPPQIYVVLCVFNEHGEKIWKNMLFQAVNMTYGKSKF